jgi:type III secretion system FlhB-like substrate exporter
LSSLQTKFFSNQLDFDEEIPIEVYQTVVEILAFIYRLSNRPVTE